MGLSYSRYTIGDTADVGQVLYDLSFTGPSPGYLTKAHVWLYVNGAVQGGAGGAEADGFSWVTNTRVQLKNYTPVLNDVIEFRRIIPKSTQYVDFISNSKISDSNLDDIQLALLYIGHELSDGFLTGFDDSYDFLLQRVGIAETASTDAASEAAASASSAADAASSATDSATSATNAAASEAAAATSATNAAASATAAETSATNAAASEAAAATYRDEIEGYGLPVMHSLAELRGYTGSAAFMRVYLTGRSSDGDGYEGMFRWDDTDHSGATGTGNVDGDTLSGIFVAPDSDPTGASGAWVRQYSTEADVRWFMADPSASAATNTAGFQAALDLRVPVMFVGNYDIDDELTLYHGSVLRGINQKLDHRAITQQDFLSSITQTTADKSAFVVDQTNKLSGYVWGIELSDFGVVGNASAIAAMYLQCVAQSEFNNISVLDDRCAVRIMCGMLNQYNGCVFVGDASPASVTAVYIDEYAITTTQTFNDCYFRGFNWAAIIKSATNYYSILTAFNDCTAETTSVGGFFIGQSCSAAFNNLYTENVPDDSVTTTGPIFKLGTSGWNGVPKNGYIEINGGRIGGGNGGLYTDSSIFEVGTFWSIRVNGAYLRNATQILKESSISFPLGGLNLNATETFGLGGTTAVNDQIVQSPYMSGTYLDDTTGAAKHKVIDLERRGENAYVRDYIQLSGTGTVISIPVTSNLLINKKHMFRLMGMNGAATASQPYAFTADFAFSSLDALNNLTTLNSSTLVSSITVSGMNITITLTQSITDPILNIQVTSEDATLLDFDSITIA
jgi:hypothetical protein